MDFLVRVLHGIAQAEPGKFWFATVAAALGGIGLFIFGFVQLRRARLLEDTPTSRVRSAAQGYVEFHGHARLLPGPEIVSPLSGQRCCWWDYKIEQRRTEHRGGKRHNEWVTIDARTSDELFLLDDGTGQCVVDPLGARVIPSLSRSWRGYHPRPQSFPAKSSRFGIGDYRYTEQLLRFGDWLYVIGQFQSQTAVRYDHESRDVSDLLAQWKRDQRALLQRFDSNADGKIDLDEWEVARRAAIAEVRAQQVERSVQPDLHILNKPRDRRPFILSTKTEHQLTRGLRWGGAAGVAAGLSLGAAVAFVLIARGLL